MCRSASLRWLLGPKGSEIDGTAGTVCVVPPPLAGPLTNRWLVLPSFPLLFLSFNSILAFSFDLFFS